MRYRQTDKERERERERDIQTDRQREGERERERERERAYVPGGSSHAIRGPLGVCNIIISCFIIFLKYRPQ